MLRKQMIWGAWIVLGLGLATACGDDAGEDPGSANGGGEPATEAGAAGATDSGVTAGGTAAVAAGGSGTAGATPATGEGGLAGGSDVAGGFGGSGGADNAAGGTGAPLLLIDDFEDLDEASEELEGHAGIWFTAVDKHGSTILPAPTKLFTAGTKNCHAASAGCAIVSGTTVALNEQNLVFPYARLSLFLKQVTKVADKTFDASGYTGIKLWARGNVAVRFAIGTPDTTSTLDGGACEADCGNDHSLSVELGSAWQEIDLPFEALKQDPTWGAQVELDKSKLLALNVWFPADSDYAAAFDDVAFY